MAFFARIRRLQEMKGYLIMSNREVPDWLDKEIMYRNMRKGLRTIATPSLRVSRLRELTALYATPYTQMSIPEIARILQVPVSPFNGYGKRTSF